MQEKDRINNDVRRPAHHVEDAGAVSGNLENLRRNVERSIAAGNEAIDRALAGDNEESLSQNCRFEIDGTEHIWKNETITVRQIRQLGNLPDDLQVIEVDQDNNERTLDEDEVVIPRQGYRYGKKVRYRRGMTPRIEQELELIRKYYPDAECREDGWVRLPAFMIKSDSWSKKSEDFCFRIPNGFPAQPPYGFFVKGGLAHKNNRAVLNYTLSPETPFGGIWGKFSWQVDRAWLVRADARRGNNLLSFIRSFNERLMEGN